MTMLTIELKLDGLNGKKLLGFYVIVKSKIRYKSSFIEHPLEHKSYIIFNVGLLKDNINI